jgi:hypothetical protein
MRGRILIVIAGLVAGTWASMGEMDMAIEFGLMPRATSTGTNLQVCSILRIPQFRYHKLTIEMADIHWRPRRR